MKSPYESRIFCSLVSMACMWFLYTDFRDNNKINILNLIMFLCTTYLAFNKRQKIHNLQKNFNSSVKKKLDIIDEDKELQLTKTFKKM